MRKFILMLAIMFATIFSANAQIATENAKFFDNTYVTVNVGATTPMAFDQVFPLNATGGIAVGKWFTPVWGAEIEGTTWFGSHDQGSPFTHFDNEVSHNFVRGHYLGVNGMANLSNLFGGYKGTPRLFEISLVAGTGWLHIYNPSSQADDFNGLGIKTGLDLAFNLGKTKAHTLSIRPAIYWNPNAPRDLGVDGNADRYLTWNHKSAQVSLGVAYTYHFKTSNGTHHFKTYDVEAMEYEIARLNKALEEKPKEVVIERVVTKEVPVTAAVAVAQPSNYMVFFAFDSDELDDRAKEELDKVAENGIYCVDAYASSEGSTEYNLALSQRRADAVKAYLEARGCKIESAIGHGVQFGTTTGRVAIVSAP